MSLVPQLYTVEEEDGYVEVCAQVTSPAGDSPFDFNFSIQLTTTDNTAGWYTF